MFTAEQILAAHSQVKTGADFPAYIQAIKQLGVTHYETFVKDGSSLFYGADNYSISLPAKFESRALAQSVDAATFKSELQRHQQGLTDFPTFITMCAQTGLEKWTIHIPTMTCTYYALSGDVVWEERIGG